MTATITCYPKHVARIAGISMRVHGLATESINVFMSRCRCGWEGPDRATPEEAARDGREHVRPSS